MEKKLIIAGFGGQGVVLSGELIAYAGMTEGNRVSLVPSYGPEMRGGTAHCSVILKTSEIYSPMIANPDIVIALNQPSLERFQKVVKKKGMIFYNSDLCHKDSGCNGAVYYGVPAYQIAARLGNSKIANVVMLGALSCISEIINPDSMTENALPALLKGKKSQLLDINIRAFREGFEWAGSKFSCGQ